jgi:hypothetical protein
LDKENVGEEWLADDQVSDMSVGRNGPVTRNEVSIKINVHYDTLFDI